MLPYVSPPMVNVGFAKFVNQVTNQGAHPRMVREIRAFTVDFPMVYT
jgi:hypothetical protein